MDLNYLPRSPGVYLMRDGRQKIVYVGKANDLKKRVSSYFTKHDLEPKLQALTSFVKRIDYIPTESERDSLLLEQKLIRRFKPFYNQLWRDDKSYPCVKLTLNEDYPRLVLTRQKKREAGARIFGPFSNVGVIRALLRGWWEKKFFPLRPCSYDFREEDIQAKGGLAASRPSLHRKVRSCIYLHTGDCPAPCVGRISKKDYGGIVERVKLFFSGNHAALRRELEREMKKSSERLEYEKAAAIRDRIAALDHVSEKIRVRKTDEESVTRQTRMSRALTELQEILGLPVPPLRIEAFDISNIQGTEPVASLVVFEGGLPLKADYRKFKIKTVRGPNDFAMMSEAVERRCRRLAEEGGRLPNLILLDGGKGQLSAALKSIQVLKKQGYGRKLALIRLASLAKENEEIFLPDRAEPIRLSRDSGALQVLQHIRDEAHRFAITFHRQRRNKAAWG